MDLDRLKREVVLALFSDNFLMQHLVLKGGNLLDIVYGISTRPSRDIDLSIAGEMDDSESFRQTIEKALQRWFASKGFVVFDVKLREEPHNLTEEFRSFWGGYKVEFKIIDRKLRDDCGGDEEKMRTVAMEMADGTRRFPVEISKHEYVETKVDELIDDLVVYAYSPEMLVAEKLRAICQQMPEYASFVRNHPHPRARDFLDIHTVVEHFAIDFRGGAFQETVSRVFAVKRVALRLISALSEEAVREFHRPDFASLAPTIRPGFDLQEYDFYYDYVVDKCKWLEPLWRE